MPIEYHLDRDRGILYCTVVGRITGQDILGFDRKMRSDAEMRPEFHQIADFRRVTEFEVKSDALTSLSWTKPYFSAQSKRAVIGRGPLARGMTRMFATQRGEEAGEIRNFDTLEEGEAWIAGEADSSEIPTTEDSTGKPKPEAK